MDHNLSATELENYAGDMVGNWQRAGNFAWYAKPSDAENWCIYYTHNRDSDILSKSNAAMIDKRMAAFLNVENGDVQAEHHNHWVYGWVAGYAVRVYADDTEETITPAFTELATILAELEEYPVLDEEDFYQREYDAEAIADEAWRHENEIRQAMAALEEVQS